MDLRLTDIPEGTHPNVVHARLMAAQLERAYELDQRDDTDSRRWANHHRRIAKAICETLTQRLEQQLVFDNWRDGSG